MVIGAFAIGAVGFFTGLFFRIKALMPLVALTLVISVMFSIMSHSTFVEAAAVALCSQIILQGCYIAGVLLRGILARSGGGSPVF